MEAVSQLDVCVSRRWSASSSPGLPVVLSPRRRVVFLVFESSRFCMFTVSPAFRPKGWLLVCGKGLGD